MTISLAFLALNPVKAAVEGRLPAALASSGSAIRRLNGAGSLRRSASNRNSCSAAKDLELQQRKRPIYGACAVGLHAQGWPPGTEFLDAETGRQKSPPKCVNARKDQNPGCEWPEIPAERPYLASYRKRAVCGDWMVVCTVRYEPVSSRQSLIMGVLQGIFAKNCLFCGSRPDFGSDDQRLSGKFPTFVNREFF